MTLFSRVLGLLRDVCMAFLLGTGPAAEALVVAMRLPHLTRRLLHEGSLSLSLTATLAHIGYTPASGLINTPLMRALVHGLSLRLGACISVCIAAGILLAEPLTSLLAPGLSGEARLLAPDLLRICLPYALTAALAALGMALLHSSGYFFIPALAPILFNLCILAFALPSLFLPEHGAYMFAFGFLCGGFAQWLLQHLAIRHLLRVTTFPHVPSHNLWHSLKNLPLDVFGTALPQLAMLCAMVCASYFTQGSVAALYYAERLMELPVGLLGTALGMAALPTLSRLAAQERHEHFIAQTQQAVRLAFLLTLPAAAGLIVIAPQLITLLFGHGEFDITAIELATHALWGYAPGLPAYALLRILLAACHAQKKRKTVWHSTLYSLVCLVILYALCFVVLSHTYNKYLLALLSGCVSIALWIQCLLLWRTLKKIPCLQAERLCPSFKTIMQQLAGTLCTGLAAFACIYNITSPVISLVSAVFCGICMYAGTLFLLGNEDMRMLRTWLSSRQKHR